LSPPSFDVALALVYRRSRWLVAKRSDDCHLGGLWEFPGGKCEPGETPIQAALRELREECGIEAEARKVMPAFECEYEDRRVSITPVVCEWKSGEARPIASDECRWATLAELRRLDMPAVNAEILRELALVA